MIFLIGVRGKLQFNSNIEYIYYDNKERKILKKDAPESCDNFDVNKGGLGFDINDLVYFEAGKNSTGYLVLSELVNKKDEVTFYECVDLCEHRVIYLPANKLMRIAAINDNRSRTVLNYTVVKNKYMRKMPNAVVDRLPDDKIMEMFTRTDTFPEMNVSILRHMIKLNGMKLGGSCIYTMNDKFGKVYKVKDEFWFKKSSILRLTSLVDDDVPLMYFSGKLFLISTIGFSVLNDRAKELSDGVFAWSRDIRSNLFEFYSRYENDLFNKLPLTGYTIPDDALYNLATYKQCDFIRQKPVEEQKCYESLTRLLCFKNNFKYFTKDFQKVLHEYNKDIDACLRRESLRIINQDIEDIQKVVNWCNNLIKNDDVVWKKL